MDKNNVSSAASVGRKKEQYKYSRNFENYLGNHSVRAPDAPGVWEPDSKQQEVNAKPANGTEACVVYPPKRRTYVDCGESKREMPGQTLFTDGLSSCIAIVVRSADAMPEWEYDKILAHIASIIFAGGENPVLDDQLQGLFDLDDITDLPNRQVFVLLSRDNSKPAQDAFNQYVLKKVDEHWRGIEVVMYRDPRYEWHKTLGARLWVNTEKEVYWSMFDSPIIPAPA